MGGKGGLGPDPRDHADCRAACDAFEPKAALGDQTDGRIAGTHIHAQCQLATNAR